MNTPKALKIRQNGGFTLVELLVVITIIVILTGLTLGAMGWVQKKAANDKARAQMALLENALEQYHADTGTYPEGNGRPGSSIAIYQALFGDGVGEDGVLQVSEIGQVTGKPSPGAKVYLPDLDPATNPSQLVATTGSGRGARATGLLDPFGGEWYYRAGGMARGRGNNPDFDLFSYGPDGKTNGQFAEDDINNW